MNLEEFIRTQIESVDELRALLLLHADPRADWGVMAAAGKLYIPPVMMAAILNRLAAKGFLIAEGDPLRYRFQLRTPEWTQLILELAELDRQRPVTLINAIYGQTGNAQAFADAFKIKKDT